ncbi:MAG TPA: hypothetical protein VIV64_06300 [Gammaproteobacteria bacterium]
MRPATTLDEWTDRYAELRAGRPGSPGAWLGIPLTIIGLIGVLWSLPVASPLAEASPAINYATLFLMATFVYYCILSIGLAFGAFLFLLLASLPSLWLTMAEVPLAPIAVPVFCAAFIWQLVDTHKATGRLLVILNLQYLMIGPIWLLRAAYRKLGLDY